MNHGILGLAFLLVGAQAFGQSPPSPPMQVLVSSGFESNVVPLRCGPDVSPREAGLARLAGSLQAAGEGLRIDAGDLFGASALAHRLAQNHPESAAAAVRAMGYHALAAGHRDLAAPRADLLARALALRAAGVPMLLSNLRCDEDARALCDALDDADDPPRVIDFPGAEGVRVAVIALIAPATLTNIAADRVAGLTLVSPTEVLARMTLQARAAGATHVIALYDPAWPASLDDTLRVAHGLPAGQRAEVVLANDLSGQLSHLQVDRTGLQIHATEPGRVLRLDLRTLDRAPTVLDDAAASLPTPVETLMHDLREDLCALDRASFAGASLVAPLDRQGMTTLLLDVIREHAAAEVSVINRGAVRPLQRFPLRDRITGLDVMGALPFDDHLFVGTMTGEALQTLLQSDRAPRFLVRGVTHLDDTWSVNGRPLVTTQRYRVVSTGFVVGGGDGGLGEDVSGEFARFGPEGPREVFAAWLARPRTGDITQAPVDPARRTRWLFRAFVDASWAQTSISNPRNYQDPQLARAGSSDITLDAEFRADADHPRYTLDDNLRVRLGFTRTVETTGQDTGILKSADLLALRNQLAWRGLYARRRWFQPLPYAESYLESEFSRPSGDAATRAFHHMQFRPTAGIRFELPLRSNVNLGAGADQEILDASSRFAPVVLARGELPPQVLFHIRDREVEGQLFSEFAWRAPGSTSDDMIVRTTARLSVPLFSPLSISLSYDLFARSRGGDPWALAHDLNLGLQFDLTRALQVYRY